MATAVPPTGSSHHALIANNEYQIKLVTLLNECCDHLREILHDPARGNMPRDKKQLYLLLKQYKKRLSHLKRDQLEIVFPQDKETDSGLFDITILCDVLINCCHGIQAPIGGWSTRTPQPNDFSVGADIIRIRNERNIVMHGRAMTSAQYNRLWNAIEGILRRLGYDITKIGDLKSGCLKDLDLFKIEIIKAVTEILNFNVNKNQDNIKQNQDDIKANKDSIQQNEDGIKQNQGDIKANKDSIQQNEDGIKQNQGDIKANKDSIQQNEDGIKQNQDDIKANKDSIQQNEDGITQNQGDIKANKDSIQQNEDGIKQNQGDIKANKDSIQQNEDGIKQNQDDIKANKDSIQQNEDGITQNQGDIKANKDNIHQNEDGIKQNQDDIKANKDSIQQNEDGIKQNQDDINANKDNIHQNEDGMKQNQDDIKANKDSIQQNEDGIKQNQDDIKANKDNILQNEDGIKQNQDDIKANKDSIQQNEDGITQNQGDIKANKDSIQQNEDGIKQNQGDIKANKDSIQQNEDGIKQNQDDIKANKDSIQQNEDGITQNQCDIKANKDNIHQNEDGIKQNQDDIKANKDSIQQNEDGIKQNQDDINANKDNIHQNEDGMKQNQDDIKANKDSIQQNEDGIKQNQDDIKANKDNIQQNKDGITQNQDDIKANKDNIQQNKGGIKENKENYNRLAAEVEIVKQTISSSSCDQKSSQLEETIKEQPSYILLKNFRGDFLIQFEDGCSHWSMKSVQVIITENFAIESKELHVDNDYIVEEEEGTLILIIYNHIAKSINGLSVKLVDSESKTHLIPIEDIALVRAHMCTTSYFDVRTHNSGRISEQIKCIVGAEREETNIEFICGGSLQTMEPKEYEAFERDYIQRYFTVNGKCMEEPLQIPPPMPKVTHSLFAQKIKDVIIELQPRLFTIFTHYNTKEHIRFLKLDKEFSLSLESTITDNKRILLVLPNYIINIRYTETTDAVRIQDEVKAGEEDLKELSIITKKHLRNGHLTMVNVVAAPHFEDIENIHLCVDCNLLSKKTLAEDRNMTKFFSNILQSSQVQNNVQDNKERYINIVGKVMCFMATRKALYSVPSLSKNVHEQISSLILSPQQLRHLYNNSLKKIIIGPLGSGKTVLALAHLEIAYERSENRSVIYYVIWDGNTLLKRDIVNHTKRFNYKAAVEVVVKDNVELAKDLKMNEVPTPYQLLESLVKKHVDQNLHLIIDELNGELFNKEESSLLKHYLETEDKLNNSFIIFFPQSIEKHRTLISHQRVTIHDKYKYEETGMKVLKLNRAMRTTRIIFQFLKAFENEVKQDKVTMKLPDQQSKEGMSTKKNFKILNFFSKIWKKQPQQQQEPQRRQQQQQQQRQQQPPPPPQQQGQTTSSNVTPIIKGEEESFETPVDIDVVAASIPDGDLSGNVRIDTSLKFNTAESIGHNIKGTKPLLIHPAKTPTTDKEFIPMLALVLQDVCLHHATKRLFIYNTFPQKDIFYRLLKLLKIDFLRYDKYTDWKVLNCDDITVKNPLQSQTYNLLTTIEGSRGVEAAECICIIKSNDCKLKHLTLEAMSRATQNLVLVSTSNVYQSDTVKSSTGHIISKLLAEHLVEYNVEVSNDEDTEIPFTKSMKSNNKIVFNIKPQYWKFKEMIKDLEHVGCQATDERLNAHEIVRKNLYPPGKVSNIICSYLSSTSCKLRWQQHANKYTVSRQESKSLTWNNLATDISCNQYIVDDMEIGETCKFCVVAKNHLGVSDDSIVSYRHERSNVMGVKFEDIVKIIKSNDIEKLKKLLSIHPNIVHMGDEYENTPLMWTVRNTDNTSMVEILISYGSDVWAKDGLKENSYHLAAYYDRHTILDMLCRHDVTNINRGDVGNRTPLHLAALRNISCVDVLLRYENIDVTIEDKDGRTAYYYAGRWMNGQNREIIRRKIKEYKDRTK